MAILWKATCPKCRRIEASCDQPPTCQNCGAAAIMPGDWITGDVKHFSCSNKCGWRVNAIQCRRCGAWIQKGWIETFDTIIFLVAAFSIGSLMILFGRYVADWASLVGGAIGAGITYAVYRHIRRTFN